MRSMANGLKDSTLASSAAMAFRMDPNSLPVAWFFELYWSSVLAEPRLAQEIGARFDHVLVDEYQDTNRLQASILLAMKPDGKGVTVVGDDAQSIYSFRAATVRNILGFPSHFSPPP